MGETDFDNVDIIDSVSGDNQRLYPNTLDVVRWGSTAAQTTGTEKNGALIAEAGTITSIAAYLDTAPTGANFIIDVKLNGTTVFTDQTKRPTIAINGHASTNVLPDVVTVAKGDRLTYDVAQIGSGVAGTGLFIAVAIRTATIE